MSKRTSHPRLSDSGSQGLVFWLFTESPARLLIGPFYQLGGIVIILLMAVAPAKAQRVADVPLMRAGGSQARPADAACTSNWQTAFQSWDINGSVYSLTRFDDGSGPSLFAGGQITSAGGVWTPGIARWDGSEWHGVGEGIWRSDDDPNGAAGAGVVFDDGSGPRLFITSTFYDGTTIVGRVSRWDGHNWQDANDGLDFYPARFVVMNGESGSSLYSGGSKSIYDGGPFPHLIGPVARWTGRTWEKVAPDMQGSVEALMVFDDGSGPALFAAAADTFNPGLGSPGTVMRLTPGGWVQVGSSFNGNVASLGVFDDGGGANLYAGGFFTTNGGVTVRRLAKWDGGAWVEVGGGIGSTVGGGVVNAMRVFDDGRGPALYVAGVFTSAGTIATANIAQWDGHEWSPLGLGLRKVAGPYSTSRVYSLETFDDAAGHFICAGGGFDLAGEDRVSQVACWDGFGWSGLPGYQNEGLNGRVRSLVTFDDGSGPAVFAGGYFTTAGGSEASRIAKWNGVNWSSLGTGIGSPVGFSASVNALETFNDGSGLELYVGGGFTWAGEVGASGIARWNGVRWSAVGSGLAGGVWALKRFDDGNGPALYAGGEFTNRGPVMKWDGREWTDFGDPDYPMGGRVNAFAVFDEGEGPRLFAGGTLYFYESEALHSIARWNGEFWTPVGNPDGVDGEVYSMAVYNDGSGPALFVGGDFQSRSDPSAAYLAKWDGRRWSSVLPSKGYIVRSLLPASGDDGHWLYIGGEFYGFGAEVLRRIVRWNGRVWQPLDVGVGGGGEFASSVLAMTKFRGARGKSSVFIGGDFTTAGRASSAFIAEWSTECGRSRQVEK